MEFPPTELARPARARWTLAGLPTADGLGLSLTFAASLQRADSDADRRVFAEHFPPTSQTADAVRDHLTPKLRAAGESISLQQPAEALLTDAGRAELRDALAAALRAAAFAVGVEALAPFDLDADSPGLRHKREQAHADADRSDRLRRAAEVAAEFRQLRQNAPDLDPGALLERLDPADRPAVYAAAAGDSRESAGLVYAVSGSLLLQLDPADPDAPPRLIDLPPALGPARSVQPDGTGKLLIGGRNGVAWLDPADPAAAPFFALPDAASDLGINAAALAGKTLWATHSELGLIGWPADRPADPPIRFADGLIDGPKHLIDLGGGNAAFACGGRLFTTRADGPPESVALPDEADPIVGLVALTGGLVVIRRGGSILTLDADLNVTSERHHPSPLAAACGLPWAGSMRLLLATDTGGLEAVGLHDSLVTAYHSPHRGMRALAADGRTVAAISPDRSRLLLWPAADGRAPTRELHVPSLTRHRAADVAVG